MTNFRRRQIEIAFRDGINKLTGKQQLIDQYNDAVSALSKKSDSLHGKPEQKALLTKLNQITEHSWTQKDNGIINDLSFNPYSLRSTKAKIKSKVADLNKLMQEYNVR